MKSPSHIKNLQKAATLLFLFYGLSCFSQIKIIEIENKILFQTTSHNQLISLNKNNFIHASSFKEKVKSKFGSFKFRRTAEKIFSGFSIDSIFHFNSSIFVTGILAEKFPVEVGFLSENNDSNKFWISVKVEDSLSLLKTISLHITFDAKHFWGGGEQFSITDFRNKKFSSIVEENGIGRGDLPISKLTKMVGVAGEKNSTYFPLPKFLTEKEFKFQVKPTECEISFDSTGNCKIEVIPYRKNNYWLLNIEVDDIETLGKKSIHQLPDWCHGSILGLQGGEKKIEAIVSNAIAAGNPVTAVWIQDWVGKRKVSFGSRLWWKWEPDTINYPNLKLWIDKMNGQGIKVLGYINPFIVPESPFFKQALKSNYLVQQQNGKPYKIKAGGFDAYLIDLINTQAAEWYKQLIKQTLIANGFSGWMADFGEWFPYDAKIPSGYNTHSAHNFYTIVWARINREALQESGLDDSCLVFHRSGSAGSERFVKMFWTGDQTTDFGQNDGLPSAIKAVLSSAVSEVPYNHSDVGGYTNIRFGNTKIYRNRELLYRWIEFETFTPFLRTHEGLMPSKNLQVYSDSNTIHFFARFGKIHFFLKNYFRKCADSGKIIQPLYTQFFASEDSIFQYQFLVGNDLLIAPVTKKNQLQIAVKFPEGKWRNIFDQQSPVFSSNQVETIQCPIGSPAVFVKLGSELEKQIMENHHLFKQD